jgi:hypothetical protein
MEPNEKAIAVVDAQKHSYRQSKQGIVISFLLHPQDNLTELMKLELGDVVRLYVTKPEIGA